MKSQIEQIVDAWQSLDSAIRNVSTALPFQLGDRVSALEAEHKVFYSVLTKLMREQAKV
jgi:hypothetical protein